MNYQEDVKLQGGRIDGILWSAILRRLGSKLTFRFLGFSLSYSLFFFSCFFCCFLRFSPCLADIAMGTAAICAVLSLLVVFFSTTEVNSCYVKAANVCSIPGNLPFYYDRTFKPACNKRDVCYYCVRLASLSYYRFMRMTAKMSHLHN